jgi:hypothetical protein
MLALSIAASAAFMPTAPLLHAKPRGIAIVPVMRFDPAEFLEQIRADISKQERLLAACEDEEECMLEETEKLTALITEGEDLSSRLRASKVLEEKKGVITEVREGMDILKKSLNVLNDQKRSEPTACWRARCMSDAANCFATPRGPTKTALFPFDPLSLQAWWRCSGMIASNKSQMVRSTIWASDGAFPRKALSSQAPRLQIPIACVSCVEPILRTKRRFVMHEWSSMLAHLPD